ncbi:MAG TPA: hypothetical protein PLL64_01415 [Rhodothermales bacterium]|nr:hypothetical protein [Rhodothermales bacterium]HRR09256.1 hypothetical protein [Rhodothermales bacterium]
MEHLTELFIILGTAVVMPITIVTMSLRHKRYKLELEHRERMELKTGMSDNSLTSAELKDIIRQTVEEATLPLQNKVADLEGELRLLKSTTAIASSATESDMEKSVGKAKVQA